MAAAHAGSPSARHCVDLIDKHDTGSVFLSLFKQVTDTGCAYAYEHFHKIRTGNREKRNTCFPGYCFCKEGLTRSGRAYKKKSLGDSCAHTGVFLRIL